MKYLKEALFEIYLCIEYLKIYIVQIISNKKCINPFDNFT